MGNDDWSGVRPYLAGRAVVHVATLLPDGSPHSVPVWAGVEDDLIAFFTISESRKDRNLQADPRMALSVTEPDNPLSMATVRGRVVRRITGEEAMPFVDRIAEKYTGEPYPIRENMTAFLVRPEVAWARDYSEG